MKQHLKAPLPSRYFILRCEKKVYGYPGLQYQRLLHHLELWVQSVKPIERVFRTLREALLYGHEQGFQLV